LRIATIWSPRMKRRSDATRTARMTRIGVAELGQVADEGHLPFFADGGVAGQGRVAGQAPPQGSGGRGSRRSRTASASAMARCWRARGARSSPCRTPRRCGSDGIRGRCARTPGSAATTSTPATRRRRSRGPPRARPARVRARAPGGGGGGGAGPRPEHVDSLTSRRPSGTRGCTCQRRPTSGSLPGPTTMSAMIRTMMSSPGPMLNGMSCARPRDGAGRGGRPVAG